MNRSLQLCSGMIYLEKNSIIHRDLALRNILVTMDNNQYLTKISDLGLAVGDQYYYSSGSTSQSVIPLRW